MLSESLATSRAHACIDHASLHGKPFGIPLMEYIFLEKNVWLLKLLEVTSSEALQISSFASIKFLSEKIPCISS